MANSFSPSNRSDFDHVTPAFRRVPIDPGYPTERLATTAKALDPDSRAGSKVQVFVAVERPESKLPEEFPKCPSAWWSRQLLC